VAFPVVVLTLMTFAVMPMVTRPLRRWLALRRDASPLEPDADPARRIMARGNSRIASMSTGADQDAPGRACQ
jgi:hypothetical protein